MQPRHYKSQPHLRAKQPSLRRTQSRFLETLDFAPTKLDDMSVEEVEPVDFQTLDIEQASGHTDYVESVDFAAKAESPAALNQRIEPLAATIGHPATVDARPDTSHSYKTTQHTALSEPEEIWDEEEDEDYDDQDQAYMTAHSFRSRDFTTGGATTVLAPRLTARVQRELEAARIEVEQTRAAEDFEEEAWDVSMVAEYGDEIFDYLRELEVCALLYHASVERISSAFLTCAFRIIDKDASKSSLHGDANGDSMVYAICAHGLARPSSQPLWPAPGDTLPDCQLHRSILIIQGHFGYKAAAGRRHSSAGGVQVRGDQLPFHGRDCVHGGQWLLAR